MNIKQVLFIINLKDMELNQQEKELQYADLFRVIHTVTLQSNDIPDEVIVLIGSTRVGKTTIIRWMTAPETLIGGRLGKNRIYVDAPGITNQAAIGHTMVSVTIVPNRRYLKLGDKIILILDLGGFGERKGSLDILKVNYSIMSYLLKINKVKFIIVIPEKGFGDISSHIYRDSFTEFLNLFDFQIMKKQEKMNLFSSVSICLTAARDQKKKILLQQFDINTEGLRQLNLKNPGYMPKFSQYQELLNNIQEGDRFSIFPEAIQGKKPPKCQILEYFNSKRWQYWQSGDKQKDLICCPLADQYSKFSQHEKEICVKHIKQRFGLPNELYHHFQDLLKELVNSSPQLEIFQTNFFEKLQQFINKHHFYQDIPKQEKKAMPKVRIVQKFHLFKKLFDISSKILLFTEWKLEEKHLQKLSQYQCLKKYYSYLLEMFNEEMNIFHKLLGTTSKKRLYLDQVSFIIEETLKEITIFQSINKKSEIDKNGDITSCLREIYKQLNFGNIFIESKQSLDRKFVEQLTKSINSVPYQSPEQYQECINELLDLESQSSQLNPIEIYKILERYHFLQFELYCGFKDSEFDIISISDFVEKIELLCFEREIFELSFTCFLKALFFSLEHQVYLAKESKKVKLNLISSQQKYLKSVMILLMMSGNENTALQLCYDLKPIFLIKFVGQCNFQLSKKNSSLKKYQAFSKFLKAIKINQDILKKVNTSFMPVDKLNKLIQVAHLQLMQTDCPFFFNQKEELKRYKARMANTSMEQIIPKQLPSNPSSIQYSNYVDNFLLPFVEGKLVTILLSAGPMKGVTVAAYAVAGKILQFKSIIKNNKSELVYDRLEDAKDNRINHYGNNPTFVPCRVVASHSEVVIDWGSTLYQQPDKILFASIILREIMKKSKGFRFMFIVKEDDVLESQCEDIISLLSFIMNIFGIQDKSSPLINFLGNSLSLLINFSQNHSLAVKKIKQIGNQLTEELNQMIIKKKYHLSLEQLKACSQLFTYLQRRVVHIGVPESSSGKFKTANLLRPEEGTSLEANNDRWQYLTTSPTESKFLQIITSKMDENQILILKDFIKNILVDLRESTQQLFNLLADQYGAFKTQSHWDSSDIFQKIYQWLGSPQLKKVEEDREIGSCRKKLNIISQLFLIKSAFQNLDFDFFLPKDYSKFYDKLIHMTQTIFDNTQVLCCSCFQEQEIMKAWKKQTCSLLNKLKIMSESLGYSQVSQELNLIRQIWGDINSNFNICENMLQVIKKQFQGSLSQIRNIEFKQEKEYCLRAYKQILEKIKEESNKMENSKYDSAVTR